MVVALKAGDRYTQNDGADRRIGRVTETDVYVEYLSGEDVKDTAEFPVSDVKRMIGSGRWGQLLAPEAEAADYEKILDFTLAWLNEKHPAVLRELHEAVGRECDKRGLSRG